MQRDEMKELLLKWRSINSRERVLWQHEKQQTQKTGKSADNCCMIIHSLCSLIHSVPAFTLFIYSFIYYVLQKYYNIKQYEKDQPKQLRDICMNCKKWC